jgi:hypothetical protein
MRDSDSILPEVVAASDFRHDRRRWLIGGAALAGTAWLGGCATSYQSNPPAGVNPRVETPRLAVGDEWRFDVVNRFNGEKQRAFVRRIVASTPQELRCEVRIDGATNAVVEQYLPGWNPAQRSAGPGLSNYRFEPSLTAFQFPLESGKTWVVRVAGTDTVTRRRNRVVVRGTVDGWERIRVPAGEFDTLRVRREIELGDGDMFRSQTEVLETEWYAPHVGGVVRTDIRSEYWQTASPGDPGGGAPRMKGDWEVASLTGWSRGQGT